MKKGTKIALIVIGAVDAGCALTLAFGGIPLVKKADQEFTLYQDFEIAPYPYADRSMRYSVLLKASDEETLTYMLNSVKLDPGKAEAEGDIT